MNVRDLPELQHVLATVVFCAAAFGGEHRTRADEVVGARLAAQGLPNRAEAISRQRRITSSMTTTAACSRRKQRLLRATWVAD